MAQTGTLISGSQALQLFTQQVWAGTDMDLYPPLATYGQVIRYLEQHGYTPVPFNAPSAEPAMEYEEYHTVGAVHTLRSGNLTVQVIVPAPGHTAVSVILGFHMTCVCNIIAWDRAFCLYPESTIDLRIALVLRPITDTIADSIRKYATRGFSSAATAFGNELSDTDGSTYRFVDVEGVEIDVSSGIFAVRGRIDVVLQMSLHRYGIDGAPVEVENVLVPVELKTGPSQPRTSHRAQIAWYTVLSSVLSGNLARTGLLLNLTSLTHEFVHVRPADPTKFDT
ncbi:hypothetical protein CALVIDRAFT_562174 [Calocera viscosa TUFC12733]|uniref:PD-(D/E)XK endonuclease-like domain-containing protein n=1 Tax=Calocera viscosa (strain TUFC12733) TaxID=1330018 RepID=A0A167NZE0_CALVF|nr:hypothetical protein CALVIDRAFT_562174 [Calocera viscosa TUFC12733]